MHGHKTSQRIAPYGALGGRHNDDQECKRQKNSRAKENTRNIQGDEGERIKREIRKIRKITASNIRSWKVGADITMQIWIEGGRPGCVVIALQGPSRLRPLKTSSKYCLSSRRGVGFRQFVRTR